MTSFDRVDESADRVALVAYLDEAKAQPFFREVGQLLLAELAVGPGCRVLDVGCGTGADALAIAALVAPGGSVVGVDASATMVAEARRRGAGRSLAVEFRQAPAERLDLPDASFDACRFERVLQHVADPLAALREAARVLRPGGRVAASEPDWRRVAVAGAGADPAVTRRVLNVRLAAFPAPAVGTRLPGLLAAAGFERVRSLELRLSGCHPLALRALRPETYAAAAVAAGAIAGAERTGWLRALDRAATDGTLDVRASLRLAAAQRPAAR